MNRAFGRGVLCAALIIGSAAHGRAATGAPAWEQSYARAVDASNVQAPLAARELADGTRMVVFQDVQAFVAVRHDAGGAVVSTAGFKPAYTINVESSFDEATPAVVAIDAFGGVFVGAIAGLSGGPFYTYGDAWFMKFDGLTGDSAWDEAAVWSSEGGRRASPRALLVDDRGDLVASILASGGGNLVNQVTLKIGGSDGALVWGPVQLDAVLRAAAVLDGAGNVSVAVGRSMGASTGIIAIRYAGASGSVLWGPVELDTSADETPRAAAIAPDGSLLVAGQFATPTSRGFQTEAFDGLSGALRWGPVRWTAPPGTSDAPASTITASAAGRVFVGGNADSTSVLLALRASDGAETWGPVLEAGTAAPAALAAIGNGDLIVHRRRYDSSEGRTRLETTRRRGADGYVQWGPVEQESTENARIAPNAVVTSRGGFLVATTAYVDGKGGRGLVQERALASGDVLWGPATFAGPPGAWNATLHELAVGPDGNPIVTGEVDGPEGRSWATLKYDASNGEVLWGPKFFDTGSYGSSNPYQVVTDGAGNAIVAGYAETPEFELRMVVIKYAAATGEPLWTSDVVSNLIPASLAVDPSGNPVIAGEMYTGTDYDTVLVKLSGSTGDVLWGPTFYAMGADEQVTNIAVDAAGDVVVSGSEYDGSEGTQDWYTFKVAGSSGALVWGPATFAGANQVPERAVIDANGDVVIVGFVNYRMMTIKYSGATGQTLWGPVYYDAPSGYAGATWVAVDAAADVLAAGYAWTLKDGVYHTEIVTLKYRGTDGALVWGPVLYEGDAGLDDFAYAIDVDPAGNPVVSGNTETSSGRFRIVTLKYAAATGAPLWEPVLTWPAGATDENALVVRGGRVFVGGVANQQFRTMSLVETLAIATESEALAPIPCGSAPGQALAAANGAPAYSWSVTEGALPEGLTLASDGSFGGSAQEEGRFGFRARVQDSMGASASRDFQLLVGAGPFVALHAKAGASCLVTLSAEAGAGQYEWLPGGETTPTITVSPSETTTYGVRIDDGSGCKRVGSIRVPGTALSDSGCRAPALAAASPGTGPAGGGVVVALQGVNFEPGASVAFGPAASPQVTWIDAAHVDAAAPALPAGTVNAIFLQNPDGGYAILERAWTTDFLDVPPSDPFHDYILTVLREGITTGCSGGNYCPLAPVTRAQMAVFLVRAKFGGDYAPPPASGTVFLDVPADAFAAAYIEQLAALGVTGGCGGQNYCPGSPVTRAQMAVFLLKTSLGEGYVPPPAAGIFADVAAGDFAAAWIEDLYGRGITGGCGADPLRYCPSNPNTRGQMAVFLVKAFGL